MPTDEVTNEAFWDELDKKFQDNKPDEWEIIEGLIYNPMMPNEKREAAIVAYVNMARDLAYQQGRVEGAAEQAQAELVEQERTLRGVGQRKHQHTYTVKDDKAVCVYCGEELEL